MPLHLKTAGILAIALLLLLLYSPLLGWFALLFFILYLEKSSLSWNVYLVFLSVLFCFLLFRFILSFLLFKGAKKLKLLPKISQTERIALQVGESWVEKEFFTGCPDFSAFFNQKFPSLSKEEREFLDKQTKQVCSLSTEWDFLKRKKLTSAEEEFLQKEKFFGLSIPKKYKGLGFSPFAHAKVIEKLASHNIPLSIITMVPNSLGPAKLLLKYGQDEQKDQYLADLALGQLWPCFGLTEIQAGSDASSIQSEGVLFKEKGVLKIRLNFEKRWITLSAKADLIGLAIQLKDPSQLYSEKKDLGITCVLIPSNLKRIERGFYHDPMGLPIYNAPIKGKDVIVPAESAIVGGLQQAGQGWKMLMESLSAGRSISLPALSSACGKRVSWLVGTYAFARKQFGLPIGKFSAIQEKLAEIAGLTHLMTATHTFTLSSLNQGIVSPVVSALTKYQLTELTQKIVKQGMDIMGGAGLSLGPKNKIALLHTALPLAVTVEGANTLTRTFIVYGQGLIKTHPQAYTIIKALEDNNLKSFHKKFWVFLYQSLCHFVRSCFFTLTRAYFAELFNFVVSVASRLLFSLSPSSWKKGRKSPKKISKFHSSLFHKDRRCLQKLTWSASLFAFLSNLNLLCLGGKLKTKGKVNGRFADWLSLQYMISAVLWHHRNKKTEELASQWAVEYCFSQIQNTVMDILNNYPVTVVRWFLKPLAVALKINPLGLKPSDKLDKQLADKILEDKEFKQKLCENMYFPKQAEDQFQKLNRAYDLSLKERDILEKIKKSSLKDNKANSDLFLKALKLKVISQEEFETLQSAKKAQWEAVQVDAFSAEKYFK
ncbi:MAG: DUF1974 domain-containing protein [Oligoflexia bacterium]|nr:DUF1974 domain-containing protein [Oligoflexia bacterium]